MFAEEGLEDSGVAITITRLKSHRKCLVGLGGCCSTQAQELEAFAHEEWAKIPVYCCEKRVSSYVSHVKDIITAKKSCAK